MTTPPDPSRRDREGDDDVDLDELDRGAVALLVRDTLGRVAAQTEVTPRPAERPPHQGPEGPEAPSDATIVALGPTGDRPHRRWRRPVVAAAALLLAVLAGAIIRSADPPTITETGPSATADETQRDAPDPSTTSGPPVDALVDAPGTPWAPAVCPMWSTVRAHLDESGGELDAGSYEDLLGLQSVAPPAIADDLDLLLQHAAESPAPPDRAGQLQRIAAQLDPTCATTG